MILNRRTLIALSSAATATSMLGVPHVFAADGDEYDQAKLMQLAGADKGMKDRPMGNVDSKVTVIEYASPTCSHCYAFHVQVMPVFKEKYIDTNKIQFIRRPYVRNALDAVVFLLAETAEGNAYHDIVDAYFNTMNEWAVSEKPRDAMLAVALQLGFTEESFNAALTNQTLFEGMELMRDQASKEFDLTGTPTFYVNGRQYSGGQTLEELSAAIDPLLE